MTAKRKPVGTERKTRAKPTPSRKRPAASTLLKDKRVTAYLRNVRDWHGYIRFLGMPHMRDNPDVRIDRLYVQPRLSGSHISPDAPTDNWPKTNEPLKTISDNPNLVILGDPGSGKSTLKSWLASRFARSGNDEWTEALGHLVPIPMVLRELDIRRGIDWDGLKNAFLSHEMAAPLREGGALDRLFDEFRALVMLDGIDEIGSVAVRESLREAVLEGMAAHPECRFIMTSRIVGYEEVQFHSDSESGQPSRRGAGTKLLLGIGDNPVEPRYRTISLVHVAPFTDSQIDRFARNWYALREAARGAAEQSARNLVAAVQSDEETLHLARVPNLLAMMALIHRQRAHLPNGRALLYDDIAEAYLRSIDEFRGLATPGADRPLPEKKRWLARVGLEMQRRRSDADDDEDEGERAEILVSHDEVVSWIGAAMDDSGAPRENPTPEEFVDFLARRSGLLLPRGEGMFAFTHLSLQEYFAACAIEEAVTALAWAERGETEIGLASDDFVRLGREATWRETFVFLFELLADKKDWLKKLSDVVFGENFENVSGEDAPTYGAATLLARLAANPHSGFSADMRGTAAETCGRIEAARQYSIANTENHTPVVAQAILLVDAAITKGALGRFFSAIGAMRPKYLTLAGATGLTDLGPLEGLTALQYLDLTNTGVTDLGPLEGLSALEALWLQSTGVTDLGPLEGLTKLEALWLHSTDVTNLSPLEGLTVLQQLWLNSTGVAELGPLEGLSALQYLSLTNTGVTDLGPLEGLSALKALWLEDMAVTDAEIDDLQRKLSHVNISRTRSAAAVT